ncbi:DUF805 domain-containing protein [Falsarthrobacter nasiphocae]|uniref:Uncharacterized membrane protein YhaH (DUF805 family) n=1 Tax=Falsarthrobacter nasiphocae TaxID=189863 RepID=A0AAE3YF35_9MICC|nr:DUF805 domain-containing protein [Falsarthrobacter nasiphocae]MDR6892065.1 uncharacterized membrane protein YhaH (DUF805 family) [Falsarthrobacter nasiphocae]
MTNPTAFPAAAQPGVKNPADLDRPLYGASFGEAVARYFKRYARFHGRSSRSEYWWVALFSFLVAALLGTIFATAGMEVQEAQTYTTSTGAGANAEMVPNALGSILMIVAFIFWLATLIPNIALTVRRFHDGGFSGWLFLLGLIPGVGGIILLVFMLLPSNPEGRRFDAPHVRGV